MAQIVRSDSPSASSRHILSAVSCVKTGGLPIFGGSVMASGVPKQVLFFGLAVFGAAFFAGALTGATFLTGGDAFDLGFAGAFDAGAFFVVVMGDALHGI